MRKCILALVALLSLTSAGYAAFAIFQTYAGPPQIFYNIVTDGGAACNGDAQAVTRTVSITSGTKILTVTTDTFAPGDVGKLIRVQDMGSSTSGGVNYIDIYDSPTQIRLLNNSLTTLSSASKLIGFGTDDAPDFKDFNVWARANQGSNNQVVLTIPNGSNCWFGSSQAITDLLTNSYFGGIHNLIVEATGATINATGGGGFLLGAQGQYEIGLTNINGKSARLQSVSAGSTSIQLTAASLAAGYISRFTVGNTIMVSGFDIQTGWQSNYGVPSNHQFFDWPKITAIDAGTGTISLDRPLTNHYLDTWPEYYNGSAGGLDQGGPATAYAINPLWDATIEYRGLTIITAQSYAFVRNVIFRNVTWTGCCGTVPSQNETFAVYNSLFDTDASPGWEVDKLVGTVIFDNSTVKRIDFQSSSVNQLVMSNSTIINSMFGTPKNSQITDTSFGSTLRLGAWTNGISTGQFVCARCDVTTFDFNGGIDQNTGSGILSMSSGVITLPNVDAISTGPQRIYVPGGNIFWMPTGYSSIGLFQSQALTQDATNIYIQTNEAGGFPTISGFDTRFRTHPAPQFTCDACTGDPTLVATNIQNGATPLAPLGEYGFRSYAPTSAQGNLGSIHVKGNLVSLTINVTQAYSGSGSATLNATGQFLQTTIKQSNWTTFNWMPQINLKQVGERIITPLGVTCDGVAAPTGCSGDSLGTALPEAVWIQNAINPYMGSTLGVGIQPLFTMTARTDQGVVN